MQKITGPAWQVRESQRHRLKETLKKAVYNREKELEPKHLHRGLLYFSVAYLLTGRVGVSRGDLSDMPADTRDGIFQFFMEAVLQPIRGFQRTEEEGRALLATFLEWIVDQVSNQFHTALQEQELADPKTVYHAERATDQISM